MSFSTLKLSVGPLCSVMKPNESKEKCPTIPSRNRSAFLPLQARAKEGQKLQEHKTLITITRRDMALCLIAASLSGVTILSPEPVEARVTKADMKRRIMEKLEMLREKARLSKPEAENGENIRPPQPLEKEDEPPLPKSPAVPLVVEPILP